MNFICLVVCLLLTSVRVLGLLQIRGRLNRLPKASVGDFLLCSVKKGKPELRKKMMPAIIVRQRAPFRRKTGERLYFEDAVGFDLAAGQVFAFFFILTFLVAFPCCRLE